MAITVADPTRKKTITVSGSKVVIRPLTPNQRRKMTNVWRDLRITSEEVEGDLDPTGKTVQKVKTFTLRDVDRDELAQLIEPGVVSIEGYENKPILDTLVWMADTDFWSIVFELMPHTGMSEEEVKNSLSSSEQDTPELQGDAGTPVSADKEPVSTTPEPTEQ